MKNKRIIFIGGIGGEDTFGGEPTKNKNIIKILKRHFNKVVLVDTLNSRRKWWKLWKLPIVLLFYPKTKLIISSSIGNIYFILIFLRYIRSKREVIYWGIGGSFPQRIRDGKYSVRVMSFLSTIIVEGRRMQKILNESGLYNVVTVPNFKEIMYVPQKRERSDSKTKFIFISRITPNKGVDYILNCMEKLNSNGYAGQYVVDFYGGIEDSYKESFLQRIKVIGNASVKGNLQLQHAKGYDILALYDVMLFPTYWEGEGFPGVIIDAYIAGLPIIASDWSLNSEFIIDNETGFIIPTHDQNALYQKMCFCMNNQDRIPLLAGRCQREALKYHIDNLFTSSVLSNIKVL